MTAALIIASGKTNGKKNFEPLKKTGTITAIKRLALLLQQAGIRRIVVVHDENMPVTKWVPSMNLTFLPSPSDSEMLDNIKTGLSYLQDKVSKVLISYVDVPLFSVDTVKALLAADADICIPSYHGRCGHPILLGVGQFPEILSYTGEKGLKGAIQSCQSAPEIIEVNDTGIVSDIQKGISYKRLLNEHDISHLRASFRLRIEKECPFYGPGPHLLLQLTEETGSLSEACRHMGISYSKGRKIISTMEQQMGSPMIQTQQGGRGGGYSHLTREAKDLIQCYDAFCTEAEDTLQKLFQKHFSSQFGKNKTES